MNKFLYPDYNIDRIEREVRDAQKTPTPSTYIGTYQPTRKEIDTLINKCRAYQTDIKKLKKDVTLTEEQQDVMLKIED